MPAGASAEYEAQRRLREAAELRQRAEALETDAVRFGVASVAERRVARQLAPLASRGWHFLHDRRWPGSRNAQVDLVAVGPGGLFIIDSKQWAELTIAAGRVFRGQDDVTDDFERLESLVESTCAAVAEVGLPPGEVHAVAVFAGQQGLVRNGRAERIGLVEAVGEGDVLRYIGARGDRLTPAQIDLVLGAAVEHFPVYSPTAQRTVTVPPVLDEPEIPDLDQPTAEEVDAILLDARLAEPIEHWMTFLHPDQAKLTHRSFRGPSRIRGAAGTGKTVVGLHRAAHLARRNPGARILVTTYVRTLPAVLGTLLHQFAPEVADRVDFMGVHELARAVLQSRGVRSRLDPARASEQFAEAWNAVALGGPLATDENSDYWREEIDYVIKGRGLTTLEEYLDCARTGRGRRLTIDQRRAVWSLYVEFDRRMRDANTHDFADEILLAERVLIEQPSTRYRAVIVDEAQDLSCSMIRMLALLAPDEPDALTLIADGQQSVYPGGYTLAEAGISLAGRGVVMSRNYRNTVEILEFARSVVDGDVFADIEGLAERGDLSEVERHGEQPVLERFRDHATRDARMLDRIREVTSRLGTRFGDVGVLCRTRGAVASAQRALEAAGIATVNLEHYDGTVDDRVKVGTIKRAKGLEFKQVLLPGVRASELGGSSSTDEDERTVRARRELYVAMTRARDGLWVGVLGGSSRLDDIAVSAGADPPGHVRVAR